MSRTVNAMQLLVLQWVADGADLDHPPSDTFKTSAVALQNRGLVKIDRRRGQWNATVTDSGKFYLQNGHLPKPKVPKSDGAAPSSSASRKPSREKPATDTASERSNKTAAPAKPGRNVKDETIPMPQQVRRPHKAVREIVDRKARLEVPTEQRQRALLILHALVEEAIRRGWKVTPVPSTYKTELWKGRRTRVSPGQDLFLIDAGDAPASIRLRMHQKRVEYVPTEKERADEARYRYRSYPRYDFVPTDRMRLAIRADSMDKLIITDTAATGIEDKLLRAIERIEQMSVDARAAAERHRQWEIERLEEQRRVEEMRQRADRYTSWFEMLDQFRSDFVQHRELGDAVAGLRETVENLGPDHEHAEILREYLDWAETHFTESDPLSRIWLPQGERPDLSFDEWQEWQRRRPHRR